jgi:hypothetical protein
MAPLKNPRHERFVAAMLEGKDATDAYEIAGYARDDANACRLKANPKVAERLAESQAEIAAETTVTVQGLLNELEDARKKATDLKQLSAAIKAIEGKAKLSGLLVERKQVEVGGPGSFDGIEDQREIALRLADGCFEFQIEPYHDFRDDDREHLADLWQQFFDGFNNAAGELIAEIRARPLKANYRLPKALPNLKGKSH